MINEQDEGVEFMTSSCKTMKIKCTAILDILICFWSFYLIMYTVKHNINWENKPRVKASILGLLQLAPLP